MNCSEVQSRLSAFYDDQVPSDIRSAIDSHLQCCADCSRILSGFEALTELAHHAPVPEPSPLNWGRIAEQLSGTGAVGIEPFVEAEPRLAEPRLAELRLAEPVARGVFGRRRALVLVPLVAASVAILAVGFWPKAPSKQDPHDFGELAAEFDEYLKTYAQHPAEAVQDLFTKYPSREVTFDEAARRVGYRPVVANSLPDGYSINSVQLMKMPCCDCIKTVCLTDRGTPLMIFEHTDREAAWFRNRPSQPCNCGGMPARVVDLESQIAVTWTLGKRSVTVIGDTDIDEVARLMPYLGKEPANG